MHFSIEHASFYFLETVTAVLEECFVCASSFMQVRPCHFDTKKQRTNVLL